jgi:hypothetical protein
MRCKSFENKNKKLHFERNFNLCKKIRRKRKDGKKKNEERVSNLPKRNSRELALSWPVPYGFRKLLSDLLAYNRPENTRRKNGRFFKACLCFLLSHLLLLS